MTTLATSALGIARPALRPDLLLTWHGDDLQVGTGPDAVLIADVPRAGLAWLRTVDGLRSWEQLDAELEAAGTIDAQSAARVLRAIHAYGGLDDAAAMPSHWRWVDSTRRHEQAGDRAAATALLRDPHGANERLRHRHRVEVGVRGDGPLADAVQYALTRSGLQVARSSPGAWILVSSIAPDLITDPGAEHYELPHLAISLTGAHGVVGPLVVPGRTSCLRCRHLHLVDADPWWTDVSMQLVCGDRRPRATDRLLTDLVALHAVLLLRRWVDEPDAIDDWGNRAYEVALPDGACVVSERPPHPLCGCQWRQD